MDELDAGTLPALDVVLLAATDGGRPRQHRRALPEVPADVVDAALERLTARALLWGTTCCGPPTPCGGPCGTRRAGRRADGVRIQLPPISRRPGGAGR